MSENLELARSGAEFTVDFFKYLGEKGLNENIVFSSLSIQLCAALAYAGATGETAEQIANGVKFGANSASEVGQAFQSVMERYQGSELLKMANKVYVKDGQQLKAEYENALKENYHAEAESIDFADSDNAASNINSWVEEKTAGKITDLISSDSLDGDTRLILLNALHFKGEWANKFDESATEEDDFWIGEEESIKVQYMNQKANFGFGFIEELDCQALEMPYNDSDLSMFVLLPSERTGLKTLAERMNGINLVDIGSRLSTEEVNVKFPKFKVDYSAELSQAFQKFGMSKMFTAEAEFDNMLESSDDLFVSKILHKACIEVNEEGSEAAAATGMIMMTRMMLLPNQFVADRPFLYMIWNKRNILFAGAFVTAPNE